MSPTRTYWLSFCDNDRHAGEQFLGVVIVEVTEAEAEVMSQELPEAFWWPPRSIDVTEDAIWLAAAIRATWRAQVNPGGEVGACDMSAAPAEVLAHVPRLQLLSKAELTALDVLRGGDAAAR